MYSPCGLPLKISCNAVVVNPTPTLSVLTHGMSFDCPHQAYVWFGQAFSPLTFASALSSSQQESSCIVFLYHAFGFAPRTPQVLTKYPTTSFFRRTPWRRTRLVYFECVCVCVCFWHQTMYPKAARPRGELQHSTVMDPTSP